MTSEVDVQGVLGSEVTADAIEGSSPGAGSAHLEKSSIFKRDNMFTTCLKQEKAYQIDLVGLYHCCHGNCYHKLKVLVVALVRREYL
jgi:hypothetical protein